MNEQEARLKKIAWADIPSNKRTKFFREVKEKLRRSLIEAKAWRSLLKVDTLAINGIVVWKENQLATDSHVRRRHNR